MQTFMSRSEPTWFDEKVRIEAAEQANRDDAQLWRWFGGAYQDGRIRWCRSNQGWLVSVDHKHLATESDFDAAIRAAYENYQVWMHVSRREQACDKLALE